MGGPLDGSRYQSDQNLGTDVPVAIIGMAARAAGAPDLNLLWRRIEAGQDVITDIPADRLPGFDAERLEARAPRAALLDRIDAFDAGFFGLSPRQAAYTDPRQRLLLEETWHALEDAGIVPGTLAGSATGVYVGSMGADFRLRCDGLGAIDQYTASGTMDAFLANRISYQFDTRGCSAEIDTACSSGLTAVVQAAWALAGGHVDVGIAGGVSVICHGFDQEAYLRAGILSPTGRVRPFSEDANGYVRGEGVGVIVMKRLADARRDGDPVRAVIRGASQSHDGRTGGQFGPSAQAQAALIRRTAQKAGTSPAALGYVEAHATGTKLGDRSEAAGLIQALDDAQRAAGPRGRLWVGALKGIIGHTEGAAGLFGVIKAVLVLEHDLIPVIPGLAAPPASLGEQGAVLGFPTEPVAWPRTEGQPRLVGVSSFGLGGANAHVMISDPPATAATTRPGGSGPRIFPLSAATPSSLAAMTASLGDWLREHPDADRPAAAWTLQVGRAALPYRAVLSGNAVLSADAVLSDENPVVAAFLAGQHADWSALWDGGVAPRRNGLPPYAFEPRSHWPRAERPPEELPPRPPLPPRQSVAPQRTVPSATVPSGAVPSVLAGLVRLAPLDAYGMGITSVPAAVQPPVPQPPVPQPPVPVPAPPADPSELASAVTAEADLLSSGPGKAQNGSTNRSGDAELTQRLRKLAGECLYLPEDEVDTAAKLTEIGLDSVLAVEFLARLNGECGTSLALTEMYGGGTLSGLAAAVAQVRGDAR